MQSVNRLDEVLIKMKFWKKDGIVDRCQKAGITVHVETQTEWEAKRISQEQDGSASGVDLTRYGRKDQRGNIVYDPGEQILQGADVRLEQFRRDLELQGFKLVKLEVFQGFGSNADAFQFVSTYARDDREKLELTDKQAVMRDWMFSRVYGNVYVWRNYGGAQLDVPAVSIRQKRVETPIDLRVAHEGRELKLGNSKIEVEFKEDTAATA